jgi:hypothetical protein
VEHVEHQQAHRHLREQRGRGTLDVHPGLQLPEARPAGLVERDDLAVEHQRTPGEGVGQAAQLGVGGGHLAVVAGEDPHDAVDVDDGPYAVPLHLERPRLLVGGGGQLAGGGQHRADEGGEHPALLPQSSVQRFPDGPDAG